MDTPLSVVICGSVRRHLDGIKAAGKAFGEAGVEVLSPNLSKVIDEGNAFACLGSADTQDLAIVQQRHLDAITRADAIYVFDPEGDVGPSVAMELGWALALGKPIFCKDVPQDLALEPFCSGVATPAEIATKLRAAREKPLASLNPRSSVADLQRVSQLLATQRGFHDEKPLEIMLLMVEEVGELAKALRKEVGLKFDSAALANIGQVELETADVFIYLLHLANTCKFDLAAAFARKEQANSLRIWTKKTPDS